MTVIHFYEEFKPYGFLSNFASCPILLKGHLWPTTEHYYQAQKYAGTPREELIRQAPSPLNAKELTRDPAFPPRADWDAVKDAVMKEALLAKFSQHSHLRALLLATGDAELVEHTENDRYWADGGDGSGLNRLGVLLMEVRNETQNQALNSSKITSNPTDSVSALISLVNINLDDARTRVRRYSQLRKLTDNSNLDEAIKVINLVQTVDFLRYDFALMLRGVIDGRDSFERQTFARYTCLIIHEGVVLMSQQLGRQLKQLLIDIAAPSHIESKRAELHSQLSRFKKSHESHLRRVRNIAAHRDQDFWETITSLQAMPDKYFEEIAQLFATWIGDVAVFAAEDVVTSLNLFMHSKYLAYSNKPTST